MNASSFRRRFTLLFAALSLTPLLASGAAVPMDFKVLIDADNRESTGCTVVTAIRSGCNSTRIASASES